MKKPTNNLHAALELDGFLCFAVYSANHAFNRLYKPLLDSLKLTYPQYLAMVALWEDDAQTVGGLCGKLFLESSTLTPMLKRLEAMGYLTRERNGDDERQVYLRLTEAGRALRKKAQEIPSCVLDATKLGGDEAARLTREITALRVTLSR